MIRHVSCTTHIRLVLVASVDDRNSHFSPQYDLHTQILLYPPLSML